MSLSLPFFSCPIFLSLAFLSAAGAVVRVIEKLSSMSPLATAHFLYGEFQELACEGVCVWQKNAKTGFCTFRWRGR